MVAPAAFGGSAMLRALAALPIDLPATERTTPFQPVAVEDIAATVAWLASRDPADASAVTWDLMQPQAITLGGVIGHFRHAFGTQGWPRIALPPFLLNLGCKLGDLTSLLGWMSPVRTTAMAELRRGVTGDPASWMAATGIVPRAIGQMVGPAATIQDFKPNVNIMPFGMCQSLANPQVASATSAAMGVLTPQPCVPMTTAPWTPGASKTMINNQPALTDSSTCTCNWAGTISITNPGQQKIDVT